MSRRAATALVAAGLLVCSATAAAQDPIPDPSANRTVSQATNQACASNQLSATCTGAALADLNAARLSEGVVPMVLPDDFLALTIPQQLLVLSNLERIDRGLAPIEGLSASLDSDAATAAAADGDPTPTNPYGDVFTSNWEGGYTSPLLSDFGWMYDDGYGSPNLDCTSPSAENCWGHRHDILWDFTEPAVMGAAYDATSPDGPSETELFVGDDSQAGLGQPDAPIAPTWATIASTLPIGLSTTTLRPARGTMSAELVIWASGEAMDVTAAVTTDAGGWSVSPSGCALDAGKSCELAVKASSTTAGAGTLTLTGPNGAQTVALDSPSPPEIEVKIKASLQHGKISRGHSTKLTGSVSPSESGKRVELQQQRRHGWSNVASAKLSRTSKFGFTIKGRSRGTFKYRMSVAADGAITSGVSSTVTLRVT